eukprot:m.352459 g.352459  ORF g.352459 m.352459 type:complete len:56 (-) comp16524_c0_seq1:898-1065(-)
MRLSALLLATLMLGVASATNTTLFDFDDLVDIKGNPFKASDYRGNVTLVINVASF